MGRVVVGRLRGVALKDTYTKTQFGLLPGARLLISVKISMPVTRISTRSGGAVPRIIEREVELELPPVEPASGWSIKPDQSLSGGRITKIYRLYYQGRDTGKYALSPQKAAKMTHDFALRGGKWVKRAWAK